MRIGHTVLACWLGGLVLAVAGCGGGKSAEISGTVKYNGIDVETGAITFIAVDGKSPTKGSEIKNGHYTVKDVPTGAMRVVINGQKVVGTKQVYPGQKNSPVMPKTEELIPAKYSDLYKSELRYDVTAGSQTKDFDLTGK